MEDTQKRSLALHQLLLLGDSALPLGSFAFSSGLESFLAHVPRHSHGSAAFGRFLDMSVCSIATLTLPFVSTAFGDVQRLPELDNDLDATINCTVARRASIAQGRALIGVWDRSFKMHTHADNAHIADAIKSLDEFSQWLKLSMDGGTFDPDSPNGHLAPLFGVVCAAMGVDLEDALYCFLFSHVKTLVSAGVRASVLGPYQAQSLLASIALRQKLEQVVQPHMDLAARPSVPLAGQSVPILDLWGGRHEILYSRIFNS